jgi:hypothetical protein
MTLNIEVEREEDGRWIAEVADLPGVLAYGDSRDPAAGVSGLRVRLPRWRRDWPANACLLATPVYSLKIL